MKNHVKFDIICQELLNIQFAEKVILQEIICELKKKDIICEEPKNGSFCIYSLCRINNKKFYIVVFSVEKKSESIGYSKIHCINYIKYPWWRRLMGMLPSDRVNSSEELEYICNLIETVLTSDLRINNIVFY